MLEEVLVVDASLPPAPDVSFFVSVSSFLLINDAQCFSKRAGTKHFT